MKITEEILKDIFWEGISISKSPLDIWVLVLICKTHDKSIQLLELIKNNRFKIMVQTNDKKELRFLLQFLDSDLETFYQPNADYQPMKMLANGEVKNIGTGFKNIDGRILCNKETIELNSFNFSLS